MFVPAGAKETKDRIPRERESGKIPKVSDEPEALKTSIAAEEAISGKIV